MLRKITMAEALKLIDKCDAVYAIKEITAETQIGEIVSELIRCKDCKFHHDRTQCSKRIGAWFDDDYCNGAVSAERKEE